MSPNGLTTKPRRHEAGPGTEDAAGENLHRKNAAEWVMFAVIYPFAWLIARLTR